MIIALTFSYFTGICYVAVGDWSGASWDLSVTQCICCFARPQDFNGFECSYPGLHRDVQRIMNDLLSTLCPRARVRGGRWGGCWLQQNVLSFVVDDVPCPLFVLCCCAVPDTLGSCHCCDSLYNNKIWLHFQFISLRLIPYIDGDSCLLSWRGCGKADSLSFTTYFSAGRIYFCPFLPYHRHIYTIKNSVKIPTNRLLDF